MKMPVFAIMAAALMLAGCAGKVEPQYPPKELRSFNETTALGSVWSQRVGQGLGRARYPLSAAQGEGVIYAADERGYVMALDADSGDTHWERDLDTAISSGLTAGSGQLFLGTRNGEVLALSQDDGEIQWRSRVSSEVLAPPQVNSQLVIVQSVDGAVTALDRANGDERWIYTSSQPALTLRGTGTPQVIEPVSFVGFANGRLATLDNRSGQPLWDMRIAVPQGRSEVDRLVDLDGQPVLTPDGRLYVTSYNGRLIALEATSGEVLWERDQSSYLTPLLVGDYLFTVDEASHILALDALSGERVWRNEDLEGRWLTAPAFADGKLVFGDFEGYVHLLDARSGTLVGRTRVNNSGISVRPITEGRRIYAQANDGRLEALQIRETQ
ncbi:outer membrane protein assembly factor BamB [Litchfieldella qijiaojingensis]|uniref:Outer membrane protein assembly factor BamB n=1 Tax=Litchfieldella qijiaojingensis TaxID=980347 RepID=A0ABQ2YUN9_9GAMM|nr:outer membrane protein assembly factor BamB [Halomonas qijiaojingensis]GGX94191.1 outer membrane protein assembly factor BamB [Halomonas qijiaojingensis]